MNIEATADIRLVREGHTGEEDEYELIIRCPGSKQECQLAQDLYRVGFDLAVKQLNRDIAVERLTKQK